MAKNTNNSNKNIINYAIIAAMLLYLANLTFGVDLIPDNLPIVGNLDEVIATLIALKAKEGIK